MKKMRESENYTMAELCPAHHINVTAWRLCPLNETGTVYHTTQSAASYHTITPSVVTLNIKALYLHTMSVLHHRELNTLREIAKLSYIQAFRLYLSYVIQRAKLSYEYNTGNTAVAK